MLTVTATDADVPAENLTYSLSGTDAALFQIDANTGVLSFKTAPDFEAPADADGNNVYDLTVQVSDGTFSHTQALAVTVTPVNDNPPTITSPATANVAENTTAVLTVTATDADVPAENLTYSLSGTDAALFQIDANTGVLSFKTAPDFEAPADADGNNVYDLTVQVSDGTFSHTQALAVTVTPVNDNPPTITSPATVNVAENTTAVMTVTATDADVPAQSLTYSLAGADAALFQIDATTGVLSFKTAPDFDAPLDANRDNVYELLVRVSDGTLVGTQTLAIAVTNRNEMPQGSDGHIAVAEDGAHVFTLADFGFIDGMDSPGNGLAAVQIVGTPAKGAFLLGGVSVIDGQWISASDIAAGRLVFSPAADDNGAAYAVLGFRVRDDGGTLDGGVDTEAGTHSLTIDVTPVNDAPVMTRAGFEAVPDGATSLGADAIAVTDVDSDASAIRFLIDKVENGHFELRGAPGVAIGQFDYADLAAGKVVFVYQGAGALPVVVLRANDGQASGGAFTASVFFGPSSMGPLPVEPPFVAPSIPPVVPPAVTTPVTPPTEVATVKPAPAPATALPPMDAAAEPRPATVGGVLETPSAMLNDHSASEARVRHFRVDSALLRLDRAPVTLTLGAGAEGPLMTFMLSGQDAGKAAGSAATRLASAEKPKIPPLADGAYADVHVVMRAVELSGVALSVGAVWWATRAGGLVASLLMAAPAWRTFDPLPVLGPQDDEDWGGEVDDEMERDEAGAADVFDTDERFAP